MTFGDLSENGVTKIRRTDPHDFIVQKRIENAADASGLDVEIFDTPQFLNTPQLNREYRESRKSWFMADFYRWLRKQLQIMVDEEEKPEGAKWSFDDEYRKKVSKNKLAGVPFIAPKEADEIEREAVSYVEARWPDNPASIN